MWRKLLGLKKSEPSQGKQVVAGARSIPDPAPLPAASTAKLTDQSPARLPPIWENGEYSDVHKFNALAESSKRSVRRKAAMDLRSYRWKLRQYMPILTRLANDPDHRVRIAALRSMAHADAGELSIILKALSDPKLGVRLEAVRALRYYYTVGPQLVEILHGSDRALHGLAAVALGFQKVGDPVPTLIEALDKSFTTFTRRKAARALASRYDVRGVAPLLAGIGDINPNIRVMMARSLRILVSRLHVKYKEDAINTLKLGFNHGSPVVQLHAGYNLAMLGDPDGVAVLTNSLLDVERSPYLTKAQIKEALNRLKQ